MSNLAQNQNQFTQAPILGQVGFQPNVDTQTCIINPSTAAAAGTITAGCVVKLVPSTSPEIVVDVTSGPSDGPNFGVIAYNPRKNTYAAMDKVEVACDQNVIWLKSAAAINRGQRVSVTNPSVSTNDATVAADVTAGDYTIGIAETQVSGAGQLIKIKIKPALNLVPSTTNTCTSVVSP